MCWIISRTQIDRVSAFKTVAFELVDQALVAQSQNFRGASAVTFGLGHRVADHLNLQCSDAILQGLLFTAGFVAGFGAVGNE